MFGSPETISPLHSPFARIRSPKTTAPRMIHPVRDDDWLTAVALTAPAQTSRVAPRTLAPPRAAQPPFPATIRNRLDRALPFWQPGTC